MITEDYVSYETAKLLKEKEFDETCRVFWKDWNGELHLCSCCSIHVFEFCHNSMLENYNDNEEINIAAPTLQMAMKWLREVHKIGVFPSTYAFMVGKNGSEKHVYGTAIINLETYELMTIDMMPMPTYEQACEVAIKYCLENLI